MVELERCVDFRRLFYRQLSKTVRCYDTIMFVHSQKNDYTRYCRFVYNNLQLVAQDAGPPVPFNKPSLHLKQLVLSMNMTTKRRLNVPFRQSQPSVVQTDEAKARCAFLGCCFQHTFDASLKFQNVGRIQMNGTLFDFGLRCLAPRVVRPDYSSQDSPWASEY